MNRPATPDELKQRKGETIYLIPGGNAARRGEYKIVSAVLIKCGNVKATVDNDFIGSFYIDGDMDNHNNSYLPFLTQQDAQEYIETEVFYVDLKRFDVNGLSIEQVRQIKAVLGWDEVANDEKETR